MKLFVGKKYTLDLKEQEAVWINEVLDFTIKECDMNINPKKFEFLIKLNRLLNGEIKEQ